MITIYSNDIKIEQHSYLNLLFKKTYQILRLCDRVFAQIIILKE